MSLAVNFGIK